MIFPALYRFAKAKGLLDDVDFTEQTIRARIDLDAEGRLIGVFETGDKKTPLKKSVSRIPSRNSKAIACLGADTANRVLPGLDPEANKLIVEAQSLFRDQIIGLSRITGHGGVKAVASFLESLVDDEKIVDQIRSSFEEKKLKVSDWITFSVSGFDGYLVEWECLKDWWRGHSRKRKEEILSKSKAARYHCIVTGEECLPVLTHGARIKVAPGGLPGGVALVSGDKSAFGSYGLEKALISPMSEEAVEGYVRAINWLGDKLNPDYHYRTADTIYLFWSDSPSVAINPGKMIAEGDPDSNWLLNDLRSGESMELKSDSAKAAVATFKSPHHGHSDAVSDTASERFYCLALSGSAARGVIRNWIDQPLSAATANVKDWFSDLEIKLDRDLRDPKDTTKDSKKKRLLARAGESFNQFSLWRLTSSLEGRGDSSSAELARLRSLLISCALLGRSHPVPIELIMTAARRIGSSSDCPPHRASLLQLLLRRLHFQKTELNLNTMPEIDKYIQNSNAFLSGRLFRALQGIQENALGDRNATVVDKYYSSASATPAAVLGSLVAKAQPHLSKIRKDKPGLAHWFEDQLSEIIDKIVENNGLKSTHDPVEQGEFALGFYYQRVLTRKRNPNAEESKDSAA